MDEFITIVKKMRQCECELKVKIHMDLFRKYEKKVPITEFDYSRIRFPQDFYIKVDNGKDYLINCSCYGYEGQEFFDEATIYSNYTQNFICILININGFKCPNKQIERNNITFVIVEPEEIINFDIFNYIK